MNRRRSYLVEINGPVSVTLIERNGPPPDPSPPPGDFPSPRDGDATPVPPLTPEEAAFAARIGPEYELVDPAELYGRLSRVLSDAGVTPEQIRELIDRVPVTEAEKAPARELILAALDVFQGAAEARRQDRAARKQDRAARTAAHRRPPADVVLLVPIARPPGIEPADPENVAAEGDDQDTLDPDGDGPEGGSTPTGGDAA